MCLFRTAKKNTDVRQYKLKLEIKIKITSLPNNRLLETKKGSFLVELLLYHRGVAK